MPEINWGKHANFHIQDFNSTLTTYLSYNAHATGTVKQVEIYVVQPPTATTTIGFKKTFLGAPTCFVTPRLNEWPTGDYMVLTFATSSQDADCTFNANGTAIFTVPNPLAASAPLIGGYTDPFFGNIVIPYFKVTTNEPWIVQDDGNVIFILGFILFFWAILFFSMIFNRIKGNGR